MIDTLECCKELHHHEATVQSILHSLPSEEELSDMAELFKVFGDSTRIRILYLLSRSELCVCDIADILGLTQPAISYQLKALKGFHLVRSRRVGKTILYSLADAHVETIIGMAKEHLEE